MLDFARAFTPESPFDVPHLKREEHSVFYRLLRPEFLRYLKEKDISPPLSSDGFTAWGAADPKFREHCMEIRRATVVLVRKVVPEFAIWLETALESKERTPEDLVLSVEMHKVLLPY